MISNGIILISLGFNINHMTQKKKMDVTKKVTTIQSINFENATYDAFNNT